MSLPTARILGSLTLTLAALAVPLAHAGERDAQGAGAQAVKTSSVKPVALKLGGPADKKASPAMTRPSDSNDNEHWHTSGREYWRHHGVG